MRIRSGGCSLTRDAHGIERHHKAGGAAVFGVVVVLSLIGVGIARQPASIQGAGRALLLSDVGLLTGYGLVGIWAWRQRRDDVRIALRAGEVTGLMLGMVLVANHAIELFVAIRPFAVIIGPVLLMLALFGAAGGAAWERTRSISLGVIAGIWSGVVAMLAVLSVAFSLNLAFEARAESQLREAFVASGMNDPGAFLVKNSLEAASEVLVRMPLVAIFLSLAGALASAWIIKRSRSTVVAAAGIAMVMLVTGVAGLWHANSLQRSARPPFVMGGVLMTGIALAFPYPIWRTLRRPAT